MDDSFTKEIAVIFLIISLATQARGKYADRSMTNYMHHFTRLEHNSPRLPPLQWRSFAEK